MEPGGGIFESQGHGPLKGTVGLWSLLQSGLFPGQETIIFVLPQAMQHHKTQMEPLDHGLEPTRTEETNSVLLTSYLS